MTHQPMLSAPGKGSVWRPLTRREVLPDLPSDAWAPDGLITTESSFGQVLGGGGVPGTRRCAVQGLWHSDCHQHHIKGSAYCYYHDKVQRGLLEVIDRDSYPVWPLPREGYVLLAKAAA